MLKNKSNLEMKKRILLLFLALFIIPLPFVLERSVSAGDPNCQAGYITSPYNNRNAPRRPTEVERREQKQFAAAQTRNKRNQPPGAGLTGSDSETRFNISFYASMLIPLVGIWALFILLRHRFGKHLQPPRVRKSKIRAAAFNPSFALAAFALWFVAAIAGGTATAPTAVTAEKREKPDKQKMTGAFNPSNKPVFKSALQIGAPVFDSAGNQYVRGGFTANLTVGSTALSASKDFDMFVAKYDRFGSALWARQASGANGEIASAFSVEGATALAVDSTGNVYVGGSFVKRITLQGGANASVTLTDNQTGEGVNYESFVAKYDAGGNLLWARGGNSGSPQSANNLETGQNAIDQIVIDGDGNPYVAGFVAGSNFLGTPVAGNGATDILLAKLDAASGAPIWKQVDDNGRR